MRISKVMCWSLLGLLPVAANADMCTTIDDNLNIIEYECGSSSVVEPKLDSDYATYVRLGASFAPESDVLAGLGLRVFNSEKMFYDMEIAAAYTSHDMADSYSLFLNGRLGYKLMSNLMVYGGVGVGYSYLDEVVYRFEMTYRHEVHALSARFSLGAEYNIYKQLSMFVEYANMWQISEYNFNLFSVGVKYTF